MQNRNHSVTIILFAISLLFVHIQKSGAQDVFMKNVSSSVQLEGARMRAIDGRLVHVEDAEQLRISGDVCLFIALKERDLRTCYYFNGFKLVDDDIFYLCNNGEVIHYIGSPKGTFPMNPDLLDPGGVAPVILSLNEIKDLDIKQIVESLETGNSYQKEKAAWNLWKLTCHKYIETMIIKLQDTNAKTEEKINILGRFGFIYHPKIEPALNIAMKDPERLVQEAAKRAKQNLGVTITELATILSK
ncbi:MAG: hypothetical protein ACE5HI_14075 [bacterium]